MRTPLIAMILLALAAAGAPAQNAVAALSAMRLIPRPDAKRLARIEAREGKPAPERWHFIVHDPQAENGLREYVIAGSEIVAMRALSQFAETVTPADVIGTDALKVDSDKLARIAEQYAEANGTRAISLNYQFARDAAGTAPVWTVTCVDQAGKRLGEVVFDAAKGAVVSHGGFKNQARRRRPASRRAMTHARPRGNPGRSPARRSRGAPGHNPRASARRVGRPARGYAGTRTPKANRFRPALRRRTVKGIPFRGRS